VVGALERRIKASTDWIDLAAIEVLDLDERVLKKDIEIM
jgi:hypothetical protein